MTKYQPESWEECKETRYPQPSKSQQNADTRFSGKRKQNSGLSPEQREALNFCAYLKIIADERKKLLSEEKSDILLRFRDFLEAALEPTNRLRPKFFTYNLSNLKKLAFEFSDFQSFYQSQKECYESQKISFIGYLLPEVIMNLLESFEAKNLAIILNALAQMEFTKEQLGFSDDQLQRITDHFLALIASPDEENRLNAQGLDNILNALVRMGYDNSEINIKEAITNYFRDSGIIARLNLEETFMLLRAHQIQDLLGGIKDSPAANPDNRFFLTEAQVKQTARQYKINLERQTVQKARFSTSETQKLFCDFLTNLPGVTNVALKYPLYQIKITEEDAVTVTATDIKVDYRDSDTQQIQTFYVEVDGPSHFYRDAAGNYRKNSATILRDQMLQEIASRNTQDGNPIMIFSLGADQIDHILAAKESFAEKSLIEILETAPELQQQELEKKEAKQKEPGQKTRLNQTYNTAGIAPDSNDNPAETTSDIKIISDTGATIGASDNEATSDNEANKKAEETMEILLITQKQKHPKKKIITISNANPNQIGTKDLAPASKADSTKPTSRTKKTKQKKSGGKNTQERKSEEEKKQFLLIALLFLPKKHYLLIIKLEAGNLPALIFKTEFSNCESSFFKV
jgi:hypothetical protein